MASRRELAVEPDAVRAVGIDGDAAAAGHAPEVAGAAALDDGEELVRPVAPLGGGRVQEIDAAGPAGDAALEALHGDIGTDAEGGIEGRGEQRGRLAANVARVGLGHGGDAHRQRRRDGGSGDEGRRFEIARLE